jgi:hypothetical protein
MDPHYFWKLDPGPLLSQNSGAEAQNGAVKGRERSQWRRGGSKWSPGGYADSGRRFASL